MYSILSRIFFLIQKFIFGLKLVLFVMTAETDSQNRLHCVYVWCVMIMNLGNFDQFSAQNYGYLENDVF
jgi:hypothetical protein